MMASRFSTMPVNAPDTDHGMLSSMRGATIAADGVVEIKKQAKNTIPESRYRTEQRQRQQNVGKLFVKEIWIRLMSCARVIDRFTCV